MSKKKTEVKLAAAEAPKVRPIVEIQTEYQQLCTRAGHTQYQIFTLNKDLELMNDALRNLNREAEAFKKQADEAAAKAAAEAAPKEGEKSNA